MVVPRLPHATWSSLWVVAVLAAWHGHVSLFRIRGGALLLVDAVAAALDAAATRGHLAVVAFLLLEGVPSSSSAAIDGAARHGHLEVVRCCWPAAYTRRRRARSMARRSATTLTSLRCSSHTACHAASMPSMAPRDAATSSCGAWQRSGHT
ncbi:Aste57867_15384 [Aphanomyces stellatus]|uniref:Aste57867_15384 protein n=1 Tax=Aphanomyces stellatus TaxID=120398 RepID=A0A485L306_9STRA|nr:hypothetical protein As57867_015328 [Aphanomyces stellatus]VFT92190.1 Aste57867_15384 [Aphanomyces stellatus]